MNNDFYEAIKKFNLMFKLPVKDKPELPTLKRLLDFKNILIEEISEVFDVAEDLYTNNPDALTHYADWLGDIIVYVASEAAKHGINLDKVLTIIMESNFSKTNKDGSITYDDRGKVLKGENYFKPEPKIKQFLEESK